MAEKPQTKRKYQEIWERLKSKKRCVIEVHPAVYKTVKKGVIKEKDKDLGFKVVNDHDNFFLKFEYDTATQRVTISLKQTLGLEGVRHT